MPERALTRDSAPTSNGSICLPSMVMVRCFCLVLALAGCDDPTPPTPPAIEQEAEKPRRHPLIVVGLDGATWDVIDPMLEKGQLPHFQQLIDRGIRGPLQSSEPMASPVVWTTIATGRFPRDHYVLDFVTPYKDGPKSPIRSSYRRAPAVWNIASAYQLSVGILGYYVTYPPDVVNGFMVSDWSAIGSPGWFFPEDAFYGFPTFDLDVFWRPEGVVAFAEKLLGWRYSPEIVDDPSSLNYPATLIVHHTLSDCIADECFRYLWPNVLSKKVCDLYMSYFRVIDHASHASWIFHDDSDFEHKPDAATDQLLGGLVEASYRYADGILGETLAAAPPAANLLVLSDHGFGSATGVWQFTVANEAERAAKRYVTGNHRPNGIILAAGPDIIHGEITGASVIDVMPLMMALLDLPIAQDLPGILATEMLEAEFLAQHPIDWIPSYDIEWHHAATGESVNTSAIEALKRLGYVGNDIRVASRDAGFEPIPLWEINRDLLRYALLGEVFLDVTRNRTAELRILTQQIQHHAPDLVTELSKAVHGMLNFAEYRSQLGARRGVTRLAPPEGH